MEISIRLQESTRLEAAVMVPPPLAETKNAIYMKIHKETHDVNKQESKLRDFEGLWTDCG